MDQSTVPLVEFYSKLVPAARGAGFKLLITALAREADAPSFFEDVRRYWTSLDDATGPYVLVLFAGPVRSNELGNANVVHYSRRYIYNAHAYETQGLAMTGRADDLLDWEKGQGPPSTVGNITDMGTRGLLGVDTPTVGFADEHSREMYRLRTFLRLTEEQLPAFILTLLPPGEEIRLVVPFDAMGHRTFYQFVKDLSAIWDSAFARLSTLASQRNEAELKARDNHPGTNRLCAARDRVEAFVRGAADAQTSNLIMELMGECGNRDRGDKRRCWEMLRALREKGSPRTVVADVQRIVDLSGNLPFIDAEQLDNVIKDVTAKRG